MPRYAGKPLSVTWVHSTNRPSARDQGQRSESRTKPRYFACILFLISNGKNSAWFVFNCFQDFILHLERVLRDMVPLVRILHYLYLVVANRSYGVVVIVFVFVWCGICIWILHDLYFVLAGRSSSVVVFVFVFVWCGICIRILHDLYLVLAGRSYGVVGARHFVTTEESSSCFWNCQELRQS